MAFTEEFYAPERWWDFEFFQTGGADGALSDSVSFDKRFKLHEIRLRMSSAFASVEDLTIQRNCIKGSEYNLMLISEPILAVQDLLVRLVEPMTFLSDDTLTVAMSMASGVNVYGITVSGWTIKG